MVVQVSVTTPVEFEVESVQKFLQADFKHIAIICANRRKLSRIQQALGEVLAAEHAARVGCYTQDEFIAKLYDWAAADPQGADVERGKPRKQKIILSAGHLTSDERQQREAEMLKTLSAAMKRNPST